MLYRNHTGEGGYGKRLFFETYEEMESFITIPKVAGLYSFRGLDNASWYALLLMVKPIGTMGVGNQTRPNNRPMRQLIMDYYISMSKNPC